MHQVGTEGLALFTPPPVTAPAGRKPTLADRYHVWRASAEGELVFREIERRCLEEARLQPRRIAIARHVEQVRLERKLQVNQDFRAGMARELVRTHPSLKDLIELRGAA